MGRYDYLRPHVYLRYDQLTEEQEEKFEKAEQRQQGHYENVFNWFNPAPLSEVEAAEKRLGYRFPSQLRQFFLEIGQGAFQAPHNAPPEYEISGHANRILDPTSIADIKLLGEESGLITPGTEFPPDEIPVFEVADADYFFTMKPQSDRPNVVYGLSNRIIEDSFERFIWRLYWEDPLYYMADWGGEGTEPEPQPTPEERVATLFTKDPEQARLEFVKLLNRPDKFASLKANLPVIPAAALKMLIHMTLARSRVQEKECQELLTLLAATE